ncbi:leucine--tRNA ligase [Methanobrevibacter curvatus]|uniref:Leucine--tRNA ligase n=1 Tax=Methanobrevibacter curvatus TaxID=49547 RepID=A0A166D824_9EURY|nr:leucine--tRNA ligase [Methanobrevibacter curvatus]KZX15302.1 valine--tRNA ligase [Methanobrevibacter curvatus]
MEKKWQKKWEEAKLFQSNPDDREKLFINVAYPYPSGAMHIGHGRTYTVPDVFARFKRMQGFNVLFPMGWHVTGAPVIGIAKRIREKDSKTLYLYENVHKVPKNQLDSLSEPENIVNYFSKEYHNVMVDMGYSIDWRRELRTTDKTYQKFIEWQIRKLKDKDLVSKGSHPVKYCPSCGNPVGDHDLLEGEGATINELTLLNFDFDGKILPTATFRPETIFGATNLWLNPDLDYFEVDVGGTSWIISKDSFNNLSNQIKDLKIIGDVDPNDLIAKFVINPVTGKKHPILPASFVDGEFGTGVVFSVPAHAPADYIALKDLKENEETIKKYSLKSILDDINPLNVVTNKKYGEIPAQELIEKLNVKNQNDPKLEEATGELYKVEHSKGIISSHIPEYGGMKVKFAREEIKNKMISDSQAEIMYDFSNHPVVCRCGSKAVVKIMDDQWFLKYSNLDWKEKTRECLSQENIIPSEIRSNFDYYIGWLEDWACSRRIGLGTHLPWDKQWLIEPLSDSTIYMAYYTISKYLNQMDGEDLNDAFFDKVFLNSDNFNSDSLNSDNFNRDVNNEIKVDNGLVKEIQEEYSYWYPLDWSLSAKDLIANHLSFHMFHHVAIFPKTKWPKGMVIFGMGLLEGNKMSSSKGNVILLSEAIKKYGADVVRLFLMSSAEPWQDFDWREKELIGTKRRLEWFFDFANRVESIKGSKLDLNNIKKVELTQDIDIWMISQLNIRLKDSTKALEGFQTRKALQNSFFLLKKDLDHYFYRVKNRLNKNNHEDSDEELIFVLSTILKNWIKVLAPFIPHSCEEIWSNCNGKGFVSETFWPEYNPDLINEKIEKSEELIQTLVKDISQIKNLLTEDANKIHIYLAPSWKWKVYKIANEIGRPDVGKIIATSIEAQLNDDKKELSKFAQKIAKEMTKTSYVGQIDEKAILEGAKNFIELEVGSEIVIHMDNSFDPANKAIHAMPYKPAIYIE